MSSKKELRKVQLAQKTYELLVKQGLDEFSLNGFLSEIKMSKGNFYHYYSNVDELFCATISLAYEELSLKYKYPHKIENFKDRLKEFFYIYLCEEKELKQYISLINQLYYLYSNKKNVHLYNYMQTLYKQVFFYLSMILEDEVKKGLLKDDIKNMQKSIVATFDGMLTHSFILENYDLKFELEHYIEQLYSFYKTK